MCAHACETIETSGDIGRKNATRSPARTPSATRASAKRVTRDESSRYDSPCRSPSSDSQSAAATSGVRSAQRWTQFQARFSLPPTNQVAHSGPRVRSATRSHGCENSSPMSSIAAGQNRSGSSAENRWRALKSANPSRRIKRTTFACSSTSGVGLQTISIARRSVENLPHPARRCRYPRRGMRARIFAEENRKWWTLGALTFALFMVMLDNTVVNVALPAIQKDLGIGVSELEWTVTAYALTFAVLLLSGGKLGDMYGRRRIFLIGLVVFTVSSLVCGLSSSAPELIGARAVQGVGSALMMPATLSIITATFAAAERGMAIGIWAGVSAMALAIGPLLGGVITEHISWNWIFFVNVPIGILAVIAAIVVVPESRDMSHEQRLDLPGLVTSGIGLLALVYALIEAHRLGWTSATIIALFAPAAVALTAFVFLELHQRLPMLDLTPFKHGTFTGANLVAILVTLAMFGIFVFFPIYMQDMLGWSPIQTGAALLPWTVLIVIFAPIAGKLSDHVGSRWLMAAGMTTVGLCCLELSTVTVDSTFWRLLPGFILGGLGMSFVMTPMSAAVMGAAPVDKAGVASGVLNTFRQVGVALGIAIMGAIITNREAAALRAGDDGPHAFVHGLTFGMRVSAVICLGGAFAAAALIRKYRYAEQ